MRKLGIIFGLATFGLVSTVATPAAVGEFLAPNELAGNQYQQLVGDKSGTLLSVGTFRTLERATLGNFSHVVMVDYDEDVTKFNLINNTLISKSKSREEYVDTLLHLFDSTSTVEARNLKRFFSAEQQGAPQTYENFRSLLQNALAAPSYFKNSIFGSDLRFQKVHSIILGGKIDFETADLAKPNSLSRIASSLSKANRTISVIDLSNLMNYFRSNGINSSDQFKSLRNNLSHLPLSPGAQILFTVSRVNLTDASLGYLAVDETSPSDGWVYLASDAKEFLRVLGRKIVDRASLHQYVNDHFLRLSVGTKNCASQLSQLQDSSHVQVGR